ncbi:hypothetical protein DFS34DRAFT_668680 [Phlyctochytrium arcticum]|nr:hypothetical protein DFS34DRAFT_668680 [Phlyctochytrium arcticum]
MAASNRAKPADQGIAFEDEDFSKVLSDILKERLEPSMKGSYRSALNSWDAFLGIYGVDRVPVKLNVQKYIVLMFKQGYPFKTISKYLAGIRDWMIGQRRREEWEIIMDDPDIQMLKEAVRKVQGREGTNMVVRKPALTIIGRPAEAYPRMDYEDTLFMAILTTGFFGLCRLGELVWPDKASHKSAAKVPMFSGLRMLEHAYTIEDRHFLPWAPDYYYQEAVSYRRGFGRTTRRSTITLGGTLSTAASEDRCLPCTTGEYQHGVGLSSGSRQLWERSTRATPYGLAGRRGWRVKAQQRCR